MPHRVASCATSAHRTARSHLTRAAICIARARRTQVTHPTRRAARDRRTASAHPTRVATCIANALRIARALRIAALYRTAAGHAAAASGGAGLGTRPNSTPATASISVAGPPVTAGRARLMAGAATSDIASAAVDGITGIGGGIGADAACVTTGGSASVVVAGVPDSLAVRFPGGASGTTSAAVGSRWVFPEFGWPL
ncbi:hypothetical protein [Actinoplanes sp. NPDC026623]|uniref:hypothetical protein n=1 Tax=Actinoplanes sp. NPDC026623 TaxID=3155610 RepID=UPI0033D7270B